MGIGDWLVIQPVAWELKVRLNRAEASREAIVAAATKLIATKGLSGWTMSDVGKEAKRSHGLAGHHFPSKAELVAHVANELLARPLPSREPGQNRALAIARRLTASLHGLPSHETDARARAVILNQSHEQREFASLVNRHYELRIADISGDIQEGMRAGDIATCNPVQAAWTILSAYRGAEMLLLQLPEGCDARRLIEAFSQFVVEALRPRLLN